MINFKIILTALGQLLLFEAFLLLIAFGVGLIYGETMWLPFGLPILITVAIAVVFLLAGKGFNNTMKRRDGFLIVSASWILFSLLGMLPFLFGGYLDRISCAFFEAMSGFTTTGATIFKNIDHLPYSINFWRCFTHFVGGIGIVFFTVAILPHAGVGELKLFSTESVGLKIGKLHPRIKTTAHWIGGLYFTLTILCIISYYVAGMNLFDAICHSFSTLGTGGFSTHQDSFGYFHSQAIDYVAVVFMILAATNFNVLYLAIFKGAWKDLFKNVEIRAFLGTLAVVSLGATCIQCIYNHRSLQDSFLTSLFHVVSLQTTTGFTLEDFTLWHPVIWCLSLFIIAMGGCSGSTSGGMKSVRIVIAWKVIRNEFKRILHPHALYPLKINKTPISDGIVRNVFVLIMCYLLAAFSFSLLFILCGVPARDSIGCCFSARSGVGPGLGEYVSPLDSWHKLPDLVLWGLSFLMLLGRLEYYSFLVIFFPAFWRDN